MTSSVRCSAATQPGDLTELRLLVELSALRKLTDRGLPEEELTLVRKLADATVVSARRGDVLAYLQADMTFHLCLLELTRDPALCEIAALLLASDPLHVPSAEDPGNLMAREAGDHCRLVEMLADGIVSAAQDLLRQHLSPPQASRRAPAPVAVPDAISCAGS
jgi:DNA-binding GntR family transcriptional regulator